MKTRLHIPCFPFCCLILAAFVTALGAEAAEEIDLDALDAPLLFVKRHPYFAGHIYDDYYTWHPGGGIYVLENPSASLEAQVIRAVIDPTTPETLGVGVYRDPELSWDATRVLFAFKGEENGNTSLYEIGIDGRGLRRLTDPGCDCRQERAAGRLGLGHHDITPCYLPDGRIAFTSTRQGAIVPCFNSEVDTLHVMNADGTGIRCLSVNNVNEFDPAVLDDGRILFGRWEYVDKTALYMQSLWTIHPDGTNETAFFANNLAKPTALLDARPVPGTERIVSSLTPHNGQAVGAIAMIDPRQGKNSLAAIANFTPQYATEMDQGLQKGPSDPWAVTNDLILISDNAEGPHGTIQLVRRDGKRQLVHSEPDISCYSPMLVKTRPKPKTIPAVYKQDEPARFIVQDIYRGLRGVRRGEVKQLRIVEETARVSGSPISTKRVWNQAFPVSWQGSYVIKNVLGVVPVHADGSAYFEAPAGRALYFEALDGKRREVQRMRTFVQAVPGVTRTCIGCHESKMEAPPNRQQAMAQLEPPAHPEPESWGTGFLDYPTMVQPILDRNCVSCHGGEKGIAAGIDLSGGWTWAFNVSYETLIKNTLTGFLNCHNSSTHTSELLAPRTIGSGASPLAELLIDGHEGRIPDLKRSERELILAWMDTNSNYYGTWDWSEYPTCDAILAAREPLVAEMTKAGCTDCHEASVGSDWVNLRRPEMSRILRAPLAESGAGYGLAWCRARKARTTLPLITQAQQPPDVQKPNKIAPPNPQGHAVVSFDNTKAPGYQAMLAILRETRRQALAKPRVDMPGAIINRGVCRTLVSSTPECCSVLQNP